MYGAIALARQQHSDGRAYYDKKIAEGKTPKEALRPQVPGQRRHLPPAPGRRPEGHRTNRRSGPGRATGERLWLQRGRLTPRTPALRTSHSRARTKRTPWAAGPQLHRRSQLELTPANARTLDNREDFGRCAREGCPQAPGNAPNWRI